MGDGEWPLPRELAYPSRIEGPVSAEFWRDLEKPNYRSLIVGPSLNVETRWSLHGGSVIRDGVRTEMSAETLQLEIAGWHQEPYVIYRKMALHDQSLHLVVKNGSRLEVFDSENGLLLCWFVVDASGAPLRWGNVFDGEVNEHVYCPLAEFGKFNMPAWGTSTTGSWRFEYQEVRAMPEPLELQE